MSIINPTICDIDLLKQKIWLFSDIFKFV